MPNKKIQTIPILRLVGNRSPTTAAIGMTRRAMSIPSPTAARGTESTVALFDPPERLCSSHVSPGFGAENTICATEAAP